MHNLYAERMATAKDIAQRIIALCESYEQSPNPMIINTFLASVERLADLAEDIELERTLKALNA